MRNETQKNALTVGELLDELTRALNAGEITRDHKPVFYGSTGRNALHPRAKITSCSPDFNGEGNLIMAYSK